MKKIEDNNTLVFVVNKRAGKIQVKEAVSKLYNIKVDKVNTLIRPDGRKKAYVRLASDVDALEVANQVIVFMAYPSLANCSPLDWYHLSSLSLWYPN